MLYDLVLEIDMKLKFGRVYLEIQPILAVHIC